MNQVHSGQPEISPLTRIINPVQCPGTNVRENNIEVFLRTFNTLLWLETNGSKQATDQ